LSYGPKTSHRLTGQRCSTGQMYHTHDGVPI